MRIISLIAFAPILINSIDGVQLIEAVGKTSESGHWEQVWSDEFDGDTLDETVWVYDTGAGGWGNEELEYYTEGENLSVEDGCLVITARHDPNGGEKEYTSSRIKTELKRYFMYGRIEARIRLPKGQGVWPAFWMMGCGGGAFWPFCGEIDIMEAINNCDVCHGYIHWGIADEKSKDGYKLFSDGTKTENPDPGEWHTYAIEWSEDEIRWYCDDVCFHSFSVDRSDSSRSIFRKPFQLILNLAIGGWPGKPDNSIFPQSMYVDYVRVYSWEEQEGES